MVATVEVCEPRMPSWMMVEPMNYTEDIILHRVFGGSIFTFGGVKGEADTILDVFFSPLAKVKDDKPNDLIELEDTQIHRHPESSL
ncbi:unnamed protein product [Miscanthus lutarioriparius]|uniref:Uncharacterized protein n=1 Tax=Miscanthus lutarioriparius TaxID=422564 RepID=A0A811P3P9_9POAL|nr:unnamed protein product [Miscanthus lutarioriparius]